MIELNKIYNENCLETMKNMDDNCIDLTITSPPYDALRIYKGYSFPFEEIAKELYRVTKPGGVIVWVVGDAVVDGGETGSSFRQALFFQSLGFVIHDTMIYEKNGTAFPARRDGNRYSQIFEYMFIFSKGKPKTANLICDKPNRWAGHTNWGNGSHYDVDGNKVITGKNKPTPDFSPRNNIWKYNTGKGFSTKDKINHPAIFPEKLAEDHVLTWSNEGDIIYDPMAGSGTTLKMVKLNNRQYIGSEISAEYCEEIKKRLNNTKIVNETLIVNNK